MFDTGETGGDVVVFGRVPLSEVPPDAVLVIENPCPHGLPAESCEDLCFDWSPEWFPPEGPAEADSPVRPDLPGARQALACEAAASAPDVLSRTALLDVCEAAERQIRWAQAVRIRMLTEFHARHPSDTAGPVGAVPARRWVPDEVGLALDLSRFEATGQIALADRFTTLLPDTLALLETGRICWRRAESLAQATRILPDDKARQVEALVLPKAPDSTPRQLRDRIRRAIAKVDPDGEYRRHKEANKERRVAPRALEDGMASLWCYGSAEEIEAAWTMVDRLARSLGPQDPRNLQQRRFDLVMQLLQGKLTITDPADVDTEVTTLLAAAWSAMTRNSDPDSAPTETHAGTETSDTRTSNTGTSDTGTCRAVATTVRATEARAAAETGTPENRLGHAEPADAAANSVPAPGHAESDTTTGSGTATGTGETAGCAPTGDARDDPPDSPGPPDDQPVDEPAAPNGHRPGTPRVPHDVLADADAVALARRPDLHAAVRKPLVQVVVGLDTLLGSNRPAELLGHGPIDADTARALAADAIIQRLITDPMTGTVLEHGRRTYTPPAALADHVRSRDQICRGPHCTRRVRDLDHHIPFGAGHDGDTNDRNLNGYCLHCHLLKDVPGWNVLPDDDGTITWISPCGRRTTTDPFDYRDYTDDLPAWDGNPPNCTTTGSAGAGSDPTPHETDDDGPPPF